jgi:hypothetical protein
LHHVYTEYCRQRMGTVFDYEALIYLLFGEGKGVLAAYEDPRWFGFFLLFSLPSFAISPRSRTHQIGTPFGRVCFFSHQKKITLHFSSRLADQFFDDCLCGGRGGQMLMNTVIETRPVSLLLFLMTRLATQHTRITMLFTYRLESLNWVSFCFIYGSVRIPGI